MRGDFKGLKNDAASVDVSSLRTETVRLRTIGKAKNDVGSFSVPSRIALCFLSPDHAVPCSVEFTACYGRNCKNRLGCTNSLF